VVSPSPTLQEQEHAQSVTIITWGIGELVAHCMTTAQSRRWKGPTAGDGTLLPPYRRTFEQTWVGPNKCGRGGKCLSKQASHWWRCQHNHHHDNEHRGNVCLEIAIIIIKTAVVSKSKSSNGSSSSSNISGGSSTSKKLNHKQRHIGQKHRCCSIIQKVTAKPLSLKNTKPLYTTTAALLTPRSPRSM
jgi:hypothetical protein